MVSQSSPTANWDTIEDVFYRKDELYMMSWNIPDLSDYVTACARFGGPIALLRDERKMMVLGRHTAGKPKINVYSTAGHHMATLTWEFSTPVCMSWTSLEELLVLAEDGTYRLYSLNGDYRQYTLGGEVNEMGVISAVLYESGMVVLHGGLGFVLVRGWEGGRAVSFGAQALPEPPHCWTVVPPDRSTSGHVEVLAAVGETVLTVDELDTVDQHLSRGPFTNIRASPNGKFLALLTAASSLWVVSSDFGRNLSEVDVNSLQLATGSPSGEVVESLEWCGDHAVALAWKGGKVAVVGPTSECLSYTYEPAAVIIGEIDGLRIISSATCELVQKVPDSILSIFRPGSTRPAAILYEAMEQFDRKSPKADENIRSIRPDLPEAVDTCIEAAGISGDPYWQRRLLKAAMFGRAFLDLYNPIDLVNMAQTLKVLNAVRYYDIGIPLTYDQYMASSPERLVSRLLARNLHLLALRISRYLQIRIDVVLQHWACAKIAAATSDTNGGSDEELRRAIVSKFESEGGKGASYSEIAKKAWQSGRTTLATKLLDHEPRASNQVPLLLSMKADKLALFKALDSGDTDLVFYVLLHLKSKMAPGDFFSLIDDGSPKLAPAVNLLQVYGRDVDRDMLRDFYYQDDRRTESACLELEEAGQTESVDERIERLTKAVRFFSEDKERPFETKMIEDALRLLKAQQGIEKETEHKFTLVGLSVNDTILHLLLNRLAKRADKMRSDFKVPDKRFWWLKLKALAELKDWDGLEAFAKSKKSPIGYEPFVNHLLSVKQPSRAVVFVPRCEARNRVELYVKCDDWAKAAAECKDRGDKAKLAELHNRAPTTIALREVDDVIRRMGR